MKKLIFLSVLLMPMYLLAGELVDASSSSGAIPTQATTFIAKYFPNCRVVDIDREEDLGKIVYEVELDCGVTLEMNHLGEWTEVDCEPNRVPNAIVPAVILRYVVAEYPNAYVVKIERGRYNDKVDLNSGCDLVFSKDGELKYIYD